MNGKFLSKTLLTAHYVYWWHYGSKRVHSQDNETFSWFLWIRWHILQYSWISSSVETKKLRKKLLTKLKLYYNIFNYKNLLLSIKYSSMISYEQLFLFNKYLYLDSIQSQNCLELNKSILNTKNNNNNRFPIPFLLIELSDLNYETIAHVFIKESNLIPHYT